MRRVVTIRFGTRRNIKVLLFRNDVLYNGHTVRCQGLALDFLSNDTLFLFLVNRMAIKIGRRISVLFYLYPTRDSFLVVEMISGFRTFSVIVRRSATTVRVVIKAPTSTMLLYRYSNSRFSIKLILMRLSSSLLTVLGIKAVLRFVLSLYL